MPGHRRSIRLRGYDYSRGGAYFVTICTDRGRCLLEHGGVREMIGSTWQALPGRFERVTVDAFIIMPNHVHGVVFLAPRTPPCGSNSTSSPPTSLPDVVQWFKSLTTARYRQAIRDSAWHPFGGHLWQRNYYERIIRNDDELFQIREYITNNPKSWECDRENPDRIDENDIYEWLYS